MKPVRQSRDFLGNPNEPEHISQSCLERRSCSVDNVRRNVAYASGLPIRQPSHSLCYLQGVWWVSLDTLVSYDHSHCFINHLESGAGIR